MKELCDLCGRENHIYSSESWALCLEHYVEKLRAEKTDTICPRCNKGYMVFGTFDMYCSSCDYREPHVHNIESRSDGIFAFGVKKQVDFCCTCTEWDTQKQHAERRNNERLIDSTQI